ncbi:hypothetical protein [Clostridium beijerinckii]|uniref:hypothetical protein n=1 Tax=Clostridium beijerinckii TaxID=1520 RepID=UPI000809E6BE|nr:hypothetical protein [Clostridium beijerinckii]NRT70037.1 HEPN domain-containing protein [Clostridium beijerinckii]OCB00397.1 hypothetical protein BGS1_15765 [Clostridium beijerinckii]
MFDISSINKRYFEVKLTETDDVGEEISNIIVEAEPPKLKVLKKITSISKSKGEDAIDELTEAIKMILNKNRAKSKVPDKYIEELDSDQMKELLTEYFKWLNNNKNSPN